MRTATLGVPFAAIGVKLGTYYFRRYDKGDFLTIRHFRRIDMERLAPIAYWRRTYSGDSGRIDWVRAKWDVIALCEGRGDGLVKHLAVTRGSPPVGLMPTEGPR